MGIKCIKFRVLVQSPLDGERLEMPNSFKLKVFNHIVLPNYSNEIEVDLVRQVLKKLESK